MLISWLSILIGLHRRVFKSTRYLTSVKTFRLAFFCVFLLHAPYKQRVDHLFGQLIPPVIVNKTKTEAEMKARRETIFSPEIPIRHLWVTPIIYSIEIWYNFLQCSHRINSCSIFTMYNTMRPGSVIESEWLRLLIDAITLTNSFQLGLFAVFNSLYSNLPSLACIASTSHGFLFRVRLPGRILLSKGSCTHVALDRWSTWRQLLKCCVRKIYGEARLMLHHCCRAFRFFFLGMEVCGIKNSSLQLHNTTLLASSDTLL